MDVLFCFDRNYEQHFGVAVTSLLLNNPNTVQRVHLVTKDNSDNFLNNINQLQEKTGIQFLIHSPTDEKVSDLKISAHISKAAYYRLIAADLLAKDLDKVLYLDSDLVVKGAIDDLYKLDISDYILAAVGDKMGPGTRKRLQLKGVYYFNSGVILINLQKWRSQNIGEKCLQFLRNHPEMIRLWDQDALNKIVDEQYEQFLNLDSMWNSCIDLDKNRSHENEQSVIVHYTGKLKPWQSWCLRPDRQLYWFYLKQSPWYKAYPQLPKNFKQTLVATKAIYTQLLLR